MFQFFLPMHTLNLVCRLGFDESTRVAKVVKLAKVYENATNTATDIKVYKGHMFKVGDYLASVVGGKAYAITVYRYNKCRLMMF
jgi:hypothetical protein